MKKILLTVLVASFLAASLNAQSVAPNEVKVFRHPDFIGDSASYKVEEGMRHKLVVFLGDLDNEISSMLIGSDVAVMAFKESSYNDILPGVLYNGKMLFPQEMNLKDFSGQWNDSISSLVIFRVEDFKKILYDRDPFGVYMYKSLADGNLVSTFVPLPESVDKIEVRHGILTSDWDNVVDYLYMHEDMEITLYDEPQFQGESLYLPGGAPDLIPKFGYGKEWHFHFGKYDFVRKASSFVVRVRGAVPAPPERTGGGTGTTHRAPPAGDAPKTVQMKLGTIAVDPINIAGTWKSNIGSVYEIIQNKDKFTWKVTAKSQTGEGTITGDSLSATWVDPQGRGGAKGKIILDGQGKAIRIQWSNGVVFTR